MKAMWTFEVEAEHVRDYDALLEQVARGGLVAIGTASARLTAEEVVADE